MSNCELESLKDRLMEHRKHPPKPPYPVSCKGNSNLIFHWERWHRIEDNLVSIINKYSNDSPQNIKRSK
mgnify:CR=1 FL=1